MQVNHYEKVNEREEKNGKHRKSRENIWYEKKSYVGPTFRSFLLQH